MMLELFDLSRRRTAILQNAFDVVETQEINAVWGMEFSLPYDDPKNELCNPFWYVRYGGGELYRILPRTATLGEGSNAIHYTCEHVLATLMDNVLFGFHVVGNLGVYTADCIRYVLDHQLTRHWVLGSCEFARQYEYGWEQENLLGALFSIPKPLTEPYQWVTDTSTYPWRLSLKHIDTGQVPEMYIREGKNLISLEREDDPLQVCTRLYPLGYGEGVNQLGIAAVNGGVPYLQSPPEIVAKYGIIERVWADRRYENAESLKDAAQAMLNVLQQPMVQYRVGFAQLGNASVDRAAIGKVVEITDPRFGLREKTYITGLTYNHSDASQSSITIANRPVDIARSVADLADRQRIEMTYAQGATQLYAQSLQVNADARDGATINFFIDSAMRIVNKVLIKVKLERFRTYSKTSSSNGGYDTTLRTKTESQTIRLDSRTQHIEIEEQEFSFWSLEDFVIWGETESASGSGSHTHEFVVDSRDGLGGMTWITIPGQRIEFEVPRTRFDLTLPGQSIELRIPSHSHENTPGIYRFGAPKSFTLYVNGKQKAIFSTTSAEIDVTEYLVADDRTIPRGSWHSIEIRPNDLAYVSIDMYVQGFVQSRGDRTV